MSDYIAPLPDGYEIGIQYGREVIKFRMTHLRQAEFVLQQANDPRSRLRQLIDWFDDAGFEEIDRSKAAVDEVIEMHDREQDPDAEIPSPIPAIIKQIRDHFWDRALNREISFWEKRMER